MNFNIPVNILTTKQYDSSQHMKFRRNNDDCRLIAARKILNISRQINKLTSSAESQLLSCRRPCVACD